MKTYVTCQLCNKHFKRITPTHLKKDHGITIAEYQNLFGNGIGVIFSEELHSTMSFTEESAIRKYGKIDGQKKWDEYCQKQRDSNGFEYKHNKFGWTKEQFDEYNSSRAVTKENCIRRHGKIRGIEIFNNYVEKQRYAGCSIDYFKEKYGDIDGLEKYKEVCELKRLTPECFIRKYGETDGIKLYVDYINKQRQRMDNTTYTPYSQISQELFDEVFKKINSDECYYFTYNDEYGILLTEIMKYCFLDFYVPECKRAIEFFGDFWHCNPIKFPGDYYHKVAKKTAEDIWEIDKTRIELLKREHGIETMVVWEHDYNAAKEETVKKCVEFINYGLQNK